MIVKRKYIESILRQFLEGDNKIKCERLYSRSAHRGGLFRLPLKDGNTVVVKIWRIRNLKERLKSIIFFSNGRREWRINHLLYQSGVLTPEPITFFHSYARNFGSMEVMVMEDIGDTTNSMDMLKKLISEGDEAKALSLEDEMINVTAKFIDLNILDIDHQLNNFIIDVQGRLMRVDFECARRRLFPSMREKEFSEMIGRFIISHIYALQPDVERSMKFTRRLYEKVHSARKLKMKISKIVDKNLANQRDIYGVDTKVVLPF